MDKSFVTIARKLCPVCGKEFDTGELLLDRRMSKRFEPATVVGYGLCEECKALHDDGFVALIAIDPSKSTITGGTVRMDGVYRTGDVAHLRREVATEIFEGADVTVPFIFVDQALVDQLKTMVPEEDSENG